ncbi:MAG: TetR/AcrR family transcriptional regulator [Gammaproteobacteria bacterium]|nr:TetR/AcrR family transcriptional regulator [Gammaproteobacteria bacterium]
MSRSEQKSQTRQRILDAAGRVFRRGGYGGIGVDGLAKEAGVTSGAFYVHFASKADAFRESIVQAVADVTGAVRQFQSDYGADWWPAFVRFYLGTKRKCELPESCGLQSLAAEVARTDASAKSAFEAELRKVASAIIAGPKSPYAPADEDAACSALATLIGAVTLARAVGDPTLADRIASSAEKALLPTESSVSSPSEGKD